MGVALRTAGYAIVLVVAAHVHQWAFAGVLAVGQVLLATGWLRLLGAPGAGTGMVVAIAAGLVVDAAILFQGPDATLAPLAPVLGMVVVAALFQQVRRRDDRRSAVVSMAATVSGAAVTVLPAGYLATWSVAWSVTSGAAGRPGSGAGGAQAVAAGVITAVLAGAAVASLVRALPALVPGRGSGGGSGGGSGAGVPVVLPLALLAAAGAGTLLGSAGMLAGTRRGAALAVAGGTLAFAGGLATEYGDGSAHAGRSAGAILPLALGGVAAYLLGHFLMGSSF